ncbi:MAG: hypothetical protein EAY75_02090 [Bacteroidetes bacterium]|nr:MAG: hypothetical protein EAY75_02090 [Bacteroidota bacterium]
MVLQKAALANASIMALKGEEIIAFARSDSSGKFSLSCMGNCNGLTIRVSHVSSNTVNLRTDTISHKLSNLLIELQQDDNSLPEVVVKSNHIPIVQKGDTTSYAVSGFADSTERSLEDLLKKLPGFSVSNDGKLSYQGKEVSRLLIGGSEIYGKDYTIGTKNITPFIFDSVQAIQHYEKNPILKEFLTGNETVVNLVLNKDAKLKTKGAVDGNVGNGYDNTLNLYRFDKNNKAVGLYTGNNIGTSNAQYQADEQLDPTFVNPIDLKDMVNISKPNVGLRGNRDLFNQSHFGDVRLVRTTATKTRTYRLSLQRERLTQQSEQTDGSALNPDNIAFRSIYGLDFTNLGLNLNYGVTSSKPNTYSDRKWNLKLDRARTNNGINLNNQSITEFGDFATYGVNYLGNTTRKLATNIPLTTGLSFGFEGSQQPYTVSPKFLLAPTNIFSNISGLKNQTAVVYATTFGEIIQKKKHLIYIFEYALRSSAGTLKADSYSKSIGDSLLWKENWQHANADLSMGLGKKWRWGSARAEGTSKFNYLASGGNQKSSVFPAFKLVLDAKPTKKTMVLLVMNRDIQIPRAVNFLNEPIITNYSNIRQGLEQINFIPTSSLFGLASYNNFVRGTEAGLSVLLVKKSRDIYSNIVFDVNSIQTALIFDRGNTLFSSSLYAAKFVSALSSYVRIEAQGGSSEAFNFIQGVPTSFSFKNMSISIEGRTSFSLPVNFVVRFKNGLSFLQTNDQASFKQLGTRHLQIKSKATIFKSCLLSLDFEGFSNSSEVARFGKRQLFTFLNSSIRYPIKKINLTLTAYNLLGENRFLTASNSGLINSVSSSTIQGRIIMLGGQFLF